MIQNESRYFINMRKIFLHIYPKTKNAKRLVYIYIYKYIENIQHNIM